MRDPNRIPEILFEIERLWTNQPDLRFNQLINILQNMFYNEVKQGDKNYYKNSHDGMSVHVDLFNVEDDVFLNWLKEKNW